MTTARTTEKGALATRQARIALIGFGEVGQTLAADLASREIRDVTSWDILFTTERSGPRLAAATSGHVRVGTSMRDALDGRDLVISDLTESLLCARRYGVEETVLESLRDLFPLPDWNQQAKYMISRSLLHGRRRAEEMREVAKTVSESGLDPWMSAACAKRQDWAAELGPISPEKPLAEFLDSVLGLTARDRKGAA